MLLMPIRGLLGDPSKFEMKQCAVPFDDGGFDVSLGRATVRNSKEPIGGCLPHECLTGSALND